MRRRYYGQYGSGPVVTPTPTPTPTPLAPVNSSLPIISGSAVKGQTLTVTTGAWLNLTTGFAYDWKRAGVSTGATASTYVLAAVDIGSVITCTVTATNTVGSTSVTTAATVTVVDLAPVNTILPAITGTPTEGQTLSVSNGTWLNTPISYSYQWLRNGFPIVSANSSSYLLVTADDGGNISCGVAATNSGGSSSVLSNAVGPVGGATSTPNNTGLPVLTGAAIVGQRLFTTDGTWDITPTSVTYQWFTELGAIAGEVGDSYLIADADIGRQIHCAVTAYNIAAPSAPASSAATSTIADIDLSADTPVNTRTTASGVTPVHWDTAFGSKTFAGYVVRLQVAADTTFSTLLQDLSHVLTEADLVSGATIDWASDGLTAIGATQFIRDRVEASTPSGLFRSSPYAAPFSPTDAAWTPASLTGLLNWSEPTAGHRYTLTNHTTAANDTDPIGDLLNLAGTGNDVLQPSSTGRPIAHDSAGKSWMTFDGVDDNLHTDSLTPIPLTDGSGQWSAFAAVKFSSVTGAQSVVDGDLPSTRVAMFIILNAGVFEAFAFTSGGTPISASGTTTVVAGTWYNVVAVCSTTALKLYVNGTLEATTSISSALQTASHFLTFGQHAGAGGSPNQSFAGNIASAGLVAAPISSGDITSLSTYLAGTHA